MLQSLGCFFLQILRNLGKDMLLLHQGCTLQDHPGGIISESHWQLLGRYGECNLQHLPSSHRLSPIKPSDWSCIASACGLQGWAAACAWCCCSHQGASFFEKVNGHNRRDGNIFMSLPEASFGIRHELVRKPALPLVGALEIQGLRLKQDVIDGFDLPFSCISGRHPPPKLFQKKAHLMWMPVPPPPPHPPLLSP